jgi:UDP-2,3-diacylglucosamine pyrophosphatase LpxH
MGEFLESLKGLAENAERIPLSHSSKLVILSDLHLSDGSAGDDFSRNESMVLEALRSWYLPNDYLLVLNGDVEDLHKATLPRIEAGHPEFYRLLAEYSAADRLRKIVGNHDLGLLLQKNLKHPVRHALRLEWRGRPILVYHGHQASAFFVRHNYLSHFVVHYLANPLHIKNAEVPMTSKRRFKAERRIYRASLKLGIVSITGHTHRPLFESLSKYDTLRFKVENLLHSYVSAKDGEREGIAELVTLYVAELRRLSGSEKKRRSRSLYESEDALLPCLFNTGCATGKTGFTAIEIENGAISLIYWADDHKARPYMEREALERKSLEGTHCVRYVINRDMLDYVVARTELLRLPSKDLHHTDPPRGYIDPKNPS